MSDRLDELRRQRALAQQQLEWLDAEIAAEAARRVTAETNAKESSARRSRPPSPIEAIALKDETAAREADLIIRNYGANALDAETQTRRGCWTAFALSFIALGLAVGAWYFLRAQ